MIMRKYLLVSVETILKGFSMIKKRIKFQLLMLCLLLLMQKGYLSAQSIIPKETLHLTLASSISRALVENNQLQAAKFALLKAKWDKANAWLQLLPTASFNSRFTRIDERTFAERDFRRYLPPEVANQMPQTVFQKSYYSSFNVTMPLFNAMILNNLSIARSGHAAASQMARSTRENTIFLVISTYLNILKSQAVLELQEQYLELSEKNVAKAERLFEAGRYSKTEAMRWKVDLAQQHSTVAQSESFLRGYQADLKRLLNMKMQQALTFENEIPTVLEEEKQKLETLSTTEILKLINLSESKLTEVNAALSAAKLNTVTSKHLYKNSFATYLPNLSASYSYGWRENNTAALDDYSPTTVMVNLSIPVFSSFQNYSTVKSSYYAYRQSKALLQDQIQNTRFLLTRAANAVINLKTQAMLAKTNAELSRHNYRVVEQQKEKGLISNIDFIDAKLNMQNAQLKVIHGQYDLTAAMVELYYYLGLIEKVIYP